MRAFHNDIDPEAGAVLRQHVADGLIAPGVVDTRSIKDILPDDLASFTQCHFFAGGGLWSIAARMAGWPDWLPLWTGSCPCQPFSQAGKGAGRDDPRHLWPDFHRLIRARRPALVVGEQVASKAGRDWFDGVRADLEADDYACRAVDIPALAVDAPHERNRIYWIAVANGDGRGCDGRAEASQRRSIERIAAEWPSAVDREHTAGERRREGRPEHEFRSGRSAIASADAPGVTLGDAFRPRLERHAGHDSGEAGRALSHRPVAATDGGDLADSLRPGPSRTGRFAQPESALHDALDLDEDNRLARSRNGTFWSDAEWIICHDEKARRAKPGIRLLVDGFPGRVGIWRIAGNAIVPQLAAEVLRAALEEFYPDIASGRHLNEGVFA